MELLLFYLFITIFVSFVCSILEAVILSTTPTYIQSLYKKDVDSAKRLDALKSDIDTAVSSILILNTIAHTMGAAGVGAEALKLFGDEFQAIISVILTLVILYFSEIIPKTIGATYWQKLSVPASRVIRLLIKITYPLIIISKFITRKIKKDEDNSVSRDEILAVAELGEKSGNIAEIEGDMLENLLSLKNIKTKDILTPRSVVFTLSEHMHLKDVVDLDEVYIHTRIPIYSEDKDSISGFVLNYEILRLGVEDSLDTEISNLSKPIHRVSENIPVLYLLNLFIKREEQIFLVEDSFSQFVGIVTLEDAVETLLGAEIVDEVDRVADMRELAKQKASRFKASINSNQE
jgi:CBS domain containing-hemolysin-like protein